MKSIEVQGKSVDQAIEIGLFKLGVKKEDVIISIIDEGSLFNKAKVKLSLNVNSDKELEVKKVVDEFLSHLNFNCSCVVEEREEGFFVEISGEDVAYVIGKRGDCLESIQVLLNHIYNKDKQGDDFIRIILDSEGYRGKREDVLKLLAVRMANRAIKDCRPVKLDAMNSYDRKVIHTTLQTNADVKTHSEGTEPNRYLVITPCKLGKGAMASNRGRSFND